MTMFLRALVVASACLASHTEASITITVPDVQLLPNTPNQPVEILLAAVAGAPTILGVDLFVELGDGIGPIVEPVFQGAPGSTDGFDSTTGIFANGFLEGGEGPVGMAPQITTGFIFPAGPSTAPVDPNGRLAVLFIDTTGFGNLGQVFDLRLNGFLSAGFPSPSTTLVDSLGANLPDSEVRIINGSITVGAAVIPEPSLFTIWAGLAGCAGLIASRRR